MSTKPSEFALPDLPQIDLDQMLPLDPSELVSDQVSSLMGSSGIGNGMGNGMVGGGGSGTGMDFLGIKSEGTKILLIFDISASVVSKAEKAGIPFSKIKEETINLLENLNANMRFGLIQFSRAFLPYKSEMIVATSGNKKAVSEWVENNWRSGSLPRSVPGVITREDDGVIEVIKYAFELDPDVIFMISDGSFQDNTNATVDHSDISKLIKELQTKSGVVGGVKFNFIGIGMKSEDESSMKKIVRRNGGQMREIK